MQGYVLLPSGSPEEEPVSLSSPASKETCTSDLMTPHGVLNPLLQLLIVIPPALASALLQEPR